MPILSEDLTGHKNIRKVNVRNYIIFYIVDEEKIDRANKKFISINRNIEGVTLSKEVQSN